IPAGDYVPNHRPPAAPIITSVTNGKNGLKPRVEVSQEPLIDDVDDAETDSYVSNFIESETHDVLSEPKENFAPDKQEDFTPLRKQEFTPFGGDDGDVLKRAFANTTGETIAETDSVIPANLTSSAGGKKESYFSDFPSLSELQSLASELLSLGLIDENVAVGVKTGALNEGENPIEESNFAMDADES
ncbi:MAG TPA: hypothetical protein V6C69_19405, partial [Trichormus sp.]